MLLTEEDLIKQTPFHFKFFVFPPFPPSSLPGLRKAPLLLSQFLVTFHQKSRSWWGSEWQGVLRAAGEMVLPLCHHFHPLRDSSWCQALGNTGNESHPRERAPAGGFKNGLAKAAPQHSQLIFCQWEGMQQDRDARLLVFLVDGLVVFKKPASPPKGLCVLE